MVRKGAGNGHVQAQLRCEHYVYVDTLAREGDFYRCVYDGEQRIGSLFRSAWHWRCAVNRCPAGAWTEQDKAAAELAAHRHANRFPTHRVILQYDTVTKDGNGLIGVANTQRRV